MELRSGAVILVLACMMYAQAGCGGKMEQGQHPSEATPAATPSETMVPEAERLVELARRDLSLRLGVAESEVSVASVTSEVWQDTSLGCPEPGKAYAQVLTPGYRIVLEAQDKRYEYHTDSTRVVYCQRS